MTPTTTNTGLPADLIERVNALSPEQRDELFELTDSDSDPAGPQPFTSERVRLAWKEEIARRISAYMNGEVKAIPAEELLAQLEADQREDERHAG